MPIIIRKAQPEDAKTIQAVKTDTWPEAQIDIEQVEKILYNSQHTTLLASVDGQTAGFSDAFLTRSAEGRLRWEVDLLAVAPRFRRKGLAAGLVQALTEAGEVQHFDFCRALIQEQNIASQRTFQRCGYHLQEERCALMICPPGELSFEPGLENYILVKVDTFNYSGYWLEFPLGQQNIDLQEKLSAVNQQALIGCVLPLSNQEIYVELQNAGFETVGVYQWWLKEIG